MTVRKKEEDKTEKEEVLTSLRNKYYIVVAGATICIWIGLFGPLWFNFESVRNFFSCSFCVGLALWVCCIAFAYYSYCRDVGCRYDFLVLAPIYIIAGWAYLLGFQWKTLEKVAVVGCGALLFFSPFLAWLHYQRRPKMPDLLGRRLLYVNIGKTLRTLIGAQREHGVAVAVSGPWGVGKSHFINYVAADLQNDYNSPSMEEDELYCGRFVIASVDVWKSKDINGMWEDIALALASAISGYHIQLYNKWRTHLISLLQLLHFPVSSLADDVLRIVTTGVDTGIGEHGKLKSRIAHSKTAYLLILDNLDRCEKEKRDALYPLIESLKHIPGLVTICGYATDELIKQDAHDLFVGTFQKLFDLVVPLAPVKIDYLKPYMRDKLSEVKAPCPLLTEWVREDDSSFETPRQVETVIRQLSYIEQSYLGRSIRKEKSDRLASVLHSNPWHFTVFYWAVMEMMFPHAVIELRKVAEPLSFLKSISAEKEIEENVDEKNDVEVPSSVREYFMKNHNPLLQSIVRHLAKSDSKQLSAAMHQDYLHLNALDGATCSAVVKKSEEGNLPRQALAAVLSGMFLQVEEPPLYDSVVQYAISHLGEPSMIQYLRKCLDSDILPSSSEDAERKYESMYLKSKDFMLEMLDALLYVKVQSLPVTGEWEKMVSDLWRAASISLTWNIVGEMLDYLEDETENALDRQAPYVCELLRKFSVRYNGRIKRHEERQERGGVDYTLLEYLFGTVLEYYAYSFCKSLLERKTELKYGVLSVKNLDSLMPAWREYLQSGVNEYLKSEYAKTLMSDMARIKETLLSALVLEGRLLRREQGTSPIMPLSYVLMWQGLYMHCLKPNLASLSDVDNEHLREVQQILRNMKESLDEKYQKSSEKDKRMALEGATLLANMIQEMLG